MAGPLLSLKYLLCLFLNIHLDKFLHKLNRLLKLSSFSNIYHKNTPSYRPLRGRLAVSRDVFCSHNWGCCWPGMWAEVKDAT